MAMAANPERATRSVAIVGGGPAGMAAAAAALEHGLAVTVIDESSGLGGQYFKPFTAAPDLSRGDEIDDLHEAGQERAERLRSDRFTHRSGTLVWGIFEGRQLALYADDRVEIVEPDAVVLAPGAVERVAAFPGWTLPGVMTAGGAQTLLSREAILPGRRFLLAGTGPLLLSIAVEIADAGGEVVAVIEGSRLTAPVGHVRQFITQRKRLRQALDYHVTLRQRGIRLLNGHAVVRAEGSGHVREVTVARIDDDWRPIAGTETSFNVDTLCLHYGFAPSTELAQIAGCELAYQDDFGGWYARHDEAMRSSQPGIYVAGQLAGIGGADLAEATGRLAGLTVARDLGALAPEPYDDLATRARRDVERARAFAEMLNEVYVPAPGVAAPIAPDTIICRCEDVRASAIDRAIAQGADTLNDVKRHTRCGMGFCQGRICGQVLASYLEFKSGVGPERSGVFRARPPAKPIPLRAIAAMPDPDAAPSG
jgi:NADPH-dependent 2,4-dienoyl-CoA reductase/sulfur reductase-like enzyme